MPSNEDMHLQHTHRRRVQAIFIALISLFSNLLSMASQGGERAHWTDEEIRALLTYLVDHKSEAGEGVNFTKKTFKGAAESLALSGLRVKGAVKTADACKRKWATVCCISSLICHKLLI